MGAATGKENSESNQVEKAPALSKTMLAAAASAVLLGMLAIAPVTSASTFLFPSRSAGMDPDTMSVTYALQATGISSAVVEPAESTGDDGMVADIIAENAALTAGNPEAALPVDLSSHYVMFTVDPDSAIDELPATGTSGKDTILAKIEDDGSVSIVSFERDILPGVTLTMESTEVVGQAYASNDRAEIRKALERAGNIRIDFYATVDSRYLSELKTNLTELAESGAEWKAHLDAQAEAARIAAEEATRPKTVIDDQLWFNQNDFPGQYYQDYFDIPGYGCGLCSTAVALDMLYGASWNPVEVAGRMQSYSNAHGHIQYCVWAGTSYPQWAEVVSNEFGVDIRKATSVDDAKQALAEGKMIVAGNGGSVFLDAALNKHWHDGHIVCFYKTDGESVWAKDPAGCGGASIQYSASDFQQWWDWGGSNRMYILSRAGK